MPDHQRTPSHSRVRSQTQTRQRAPGPGAGFDPDQAADLRRVHARETSDHLLALAHQLAPEDRAVIEAVYLHGHTAVDMVKHREPGAGHTAGSTDDLNDERAARALRARIRRLVRRMLRPEFGYVAHQIQTWTPTRQLVARACVLHGLPIRAASVRLNLSLHTIRRHLDAVQAMYEIDRQRIADRLRVQPGPDWTLHAGPTHNAPITQGPRRTRVRPSRRRTDPRRASMQQGPASDWWCATRPQRRCSSPTCPRWAG